MESLLLWQTEKWWKWYEKVLYYSKKSGIGLNYVETNFIMAMTISLCRRQMLFWREQRP